MGASLLCAAFIEPMECLAVSNVPDGPQWIYEVKFDGLRLPLIERRGIMQSALRFRSPRIRISDYIETSAVNMLAAVREQGLEGIVAKRKDSLYEAGHRTGAWAKYRVNRGQEFVIGGYMPSTKSLDAIIVGLITTAMICFM